MRLGVSPSHIIYYSFDQLVDPSGYKLSEEDEQLLSEEDAQMFPEDGGRPDPADPGVST